MGKNKRVRRSGREEVGGKKKGGGGGGWHNVTSNPVMNLCIRNSRLELRSAG